MFLFLFVYQCKRGLQPFGSLTVVGGASLSINRGKRFSVLRRLAKAQHPTL